jgi:hypothetical protein
MLPEAFLSTYQLLLEQGYIAGQLFSNALHMTTAFKQDTYRCLFRLSVWEGFVWHNSSSSNSNSSSSRRSEICSNKDALWWSIGAAWSRLLTNGE